MAASPVRQKAQIRGFVRNGITNFPGDKKGPTVWGANIHIEFAIEIGSVQVVRHEAFVRFDFDPDFDFEPDVAA